MGVSFRSIETSPAEGGFMVGTLTTMGKLFVPRAAVALRLETSEGKVLTYLKRSPRLRTLHIPLLVAATVEEAFVRSDTDTEIYLGPSLRVQIPIPKDTWTQRKSIRAETGESEMESTAVFEAGELRC